MKIKIGKMENCLNSINFVCIYLFEIILLKISFDFHEKALLITIFNFSFYFLKILNYSPYVINEWEYYTNRVYYKFITFFQIKLFNINFELTLDKNELIIIIFNIQITIIFWR